MARGEVISVRRFWAASIGYLMLSMLLSIIVGEQSHEAGVHSLLEIDPILNAFYAGLKIVLGMGYLWILRNRWAEIAGLIAFALFGSLLRRRHVYHRPHWSDDGTALDNENAAGVTPIDAWPEDLIAKMVQFRKQQAGLL